MGKKKEIIATFKGKKELTIKKRNEQHVTALNYSINQDVSYSNLAKKLDNIRKDLIKGGYKGEASVAIKLAGLGWRSGFGENVTEGFNIYDDNHARDSGGQDIGKTITNYKISAFQIYLYDKLPTKAGGHGKHNDCLYDSIIKAFNDNRDKLPISIRSRTKFKEFLGLDRNELVPYTDVSKIEKEFKGNVSITVYGDHSYNSGIEAPLNINIRLHDAHYELKCNDNRSHTKGVLYKPREKVNVRSYVYDGTIAKVFDGKEITTMNLEQLRIMDNYDSKYLLINARVEKELESVYNEYVDYGIKMIKYTEGKFNLFKYKNYPQFAYDSFRYFSKAIKEPKELESIEELIISKAMAGGLLYAEKGYTGYGKTIDLNSFYASCMKQQGLYLPDHKGTAKKLVKEDLKLKTDHYDGYFFEIGFYHAEIQSDGMFFQIHKHGWYTSWDMMLANELKLNWSLIQDDECNAYIYNKKTCIRADQYFGDYVKYWYDTKLAGFKEIKYIALSPLWGKLMERNYTNKYTKTGVIELNDNEEVEYIRPCVVDGVEGEKILIKNVDRLYKSNYARVGAFLTSYARLKLVRMIKPYKDSIVRIHTDSITINEDIDFKDLKFSDKIGDWKEDNKYSGQIKVHHVNKIEKLD